MTRGYSGGEHEEFEDDYKEEIRNLKIDKIAMAIITLFLCFGFLMLGRELGKSYQSKVDARWYEYSETYFNGPDSFTGDYNLQGHAVNILQNAVENNKYQLYISAEKGTDIEIGTRTEKDGSKTLYIQSSKDQNITN